MSALVTELKHLISRLAKKEVKLALAKSSSLRKETQSLRARIKALESALAGTVHTIAKSGLGVSLPKAGDETDPKKVRLTARGIKALRRKTRLSQAMFAKLLGVSTLSVGNWEGGKSMPRKSTDAYRKLVEIRHAKMGARAAKRILAEIGGGQRQPPAETKRPVPPKLRKAVKGKRNAK